MNQAGSEIVAPQAPAGLSVNSFSVWEAEGNARFCWPQAPAGLSAKPISVTETGNMGSRAGNVCPGVGTASRFFKKHEKVGSVSLKSVLDL